MITFTGDLFLGNANLKIDDNIVSELNQSEYIVTNFENVFKNISSKKRADKTSNLNFTQTGLDNYLGQIKTKNVFTLGNNHINDLGQDGIDKTINLLNKYDKIGFTGAGTYYDVIKPFIVQSDGKKITLFSMSTNEPEVMAVSTSDENKGVLDYNNPIVNDIIRGHKNNVDYFVALPHWGREYIDYPSIQQRKKAYEWIDAGADLVVGTHPHVIQGKEEYKGKWIYYSLGNYVFPNFTYVNGVKHVWEKSSNASIMLNVKFDEKIVINESGYIFDTKNLTLNKADKSVHDLISKSKVLNAEVYSKKSYYIFYDRELYKTLKNKHGLINKLISYFPAHDKYNRYKFFLIRLIKKFLKNER